MNTCPPPFPNWTRHYLMHPRLTLSCSRILARGSTHFFAGGMLKMSACILLAYSSQREKKGCTVMLFIQRIPLIARLLIDTTSLFYIVTQLRFNFIYFTSCPTIHLFSMKGICQVTFPSARRKSRQNSSSSPKLASLHQSIGDYFWPALRPFIMRI